MQHLSNDDLMIAFEKARDLAHNCPIYLGDEVYHAMRSGQRATSASERYMNLMAEVKQRGLM